MRRLWCRYRVRRENFRTRQWCRRESEERCFQPPQPRTSRGTKRRRAMPITSRENLACYSRPAVPALGRHPSSESLTQVVGERRDGNAGETLAAPDPAHAFVRLALYGNTGGGQIEGVREL